MVVGYDVGCNVGLEEGFGVGAVGVFVDSKLDGRDVGNIVGTDDDSTKAAEERDKIRKWFLYKFVI